MRCIFRFLAISFLCGLIIGLVPASAKSREAELPSLPAVRLAQIRGAWSDTEIELQTSLPQAPEMMMVYRIVYPKADSDYAAKIARAFGLGAKVQSGESSLMVGEGQRALEVYPATGAFWFKDSSELWSGKKPDSLPAEAAGIESAEQFLRANGLLAKNLAFEGTGHSNLTIHDVASGQETAYDTDLHVNYRLTADGIPLEGPGGRVKVYLGQDSRLIGMYWASFELEPYRVYPLISADRALALLRENGVVTSVKQPKQVSISAISLVYFAGPGLETQEYLEPVYKFAGRVAGEDGLKPYVQYVPAIVGKYLRPLPAESEAAPSRGE